MRHLAKTALISVALALFGLGQAAAAGGMGDPSAMQRANNARCDAQKRGEYPSYHNACLPEDPPLSYSAPK